ncbi:hypothetical protein [Algoriphagus sp. CAU 1675]|uniref:hypothetical protein n=1 Tax=Algoriphagus sp. CAU 1675 TaxID=3032597 RepID=UPI0023DB1126|nr:hypothetical protein [Algoriphagus sp. CAU 1675]MDF2157672.1 hypothetical protein [Algoriphagus sp. CAU 1675]
MSNKKAHTTMALVFGYMGLLIFGSCLSETNPDPYNQCPGPRMADAKGLNVFHAPYTDNHYSTFEDTVLLEDYIFVLEITPEVLKESFLKNSLPGQAYALSCLESYNFRNISNLSVTLTAPFGDLPTGTDISYLFENYNKEMLSKIRDFNNLEPYLGLYFKSVPKENFSQLKTRTYLFLKNGTQIWVDSTSPHLKTN